MKLVMNKSILITLLAPTVVCAENWVVDTQEDWTRNTERVEGVQIHDSVASLTGKQGVFTSVVKSFEEKRKAGSLSLSQVPTWLNWEPTSYLGPKNLGDAPVALRVAEGDYWLFGRYYSWERRKPEVEAGLETSLEGFDIPLKTTALANVFDAPGAANPTLGGYHAWQSRDLVNWVHHGPISTEKGKWLTTAERVGDQTYFYYDFPNDQDPYLIIDNDLTDGKVGKEMGMAFDDPTHGSDCAVIRSLDGKFHLISENWSCLDASSRSWDSPLASHAVSPDGIGDFKIVDPAVDNRTTPTGRFDKFYHPHWADEDPDRFLGEVTKEDGNGHKAGERRARAVYEIHSPAQEAYGDWAAIAIGGQYYLFGDYDPANAHGRNAMKTIWFTADDINKPFEKCGTVGQGHPDPDIIFAEGRFWIVSQTEDFVSDGPWIDGVEVRVGVDTDDDQKIDEWTEWVRVKETYAGKPGFAKHVDKTPAEMSLSDLPEGYGFQYEIRLSDVTKNGAKPEINQVRFNFSE